MVKDLSILPPMMNWIFKAQCPTQKLEAFDRALKWYESQGLFNLLLEKEQRDIAARK